MNAFEKWQVINDLIGNVLLFATLIIAGLIGFKQMRISAEQTQINQRLLDLEYELSIDLEYDRDKKVVVLWNRGRRNIYFGGVRFGGSGPLEPSPRQITVGGKYEIRPHQDFEELAGSDGGFDQDVDFYLMDERRLKYLLRVPTSIQNRHGKLYSVDFRKGAAEKVD